MSSEPANELCHTVFCDRHVSLEAKIVEFAGWRMPVQYPTGIVAEHLATRKGAGLFDVSHMGRFVFRGADSVAFLQHALTNNAAALDEWTAQYTMIPTPTGGAVDDAYLYRRSGDEFLLVVNAANRAKDWGHFRTLLTDADFGDIELTDETFNIVMLSLQGPTSRGILEATITDGALPEPMRNAMSELRIGEATATVARTGYTGEPLCFELFIPAEQGPAIWDALTEAGATPVGLGARDTLRLEAALPLYGHELGEDTDGTEIPVMACPLARFAVSFSPLKGKFIGRAALAAQYEAMCRFDDGDFSDMAALPRRVQPVALLERGVARQGAAVSKAGAPVGTITSGTMVPLWHVQGEGLASRLTDQHALRSVALAYLNSDVLEGDEIEIDIRGKAVPAIVVPYHLRSEAPPYARPIVVGHVEPSAQPATDDPPAAARALLGKAIDNTHWRQQQCINLIPSEMTISPMARMLSIMDPAFRYAEHRASKAFYDAEVFYYQGTGFVDEVERLLEAELRKFLGAAEVETRLISGQMANTTVFSALVDFLNRSRRKQEPRRIRCVMNNHIGRGGHLSAQPMGALRDYVAHDPRTERAAVVNFPALADNAYKIDVAAACELIDEYRPELIIFGKSMVLHTEPVVEIRRYLDDAGIDAIVMYDAAHVLGLIGPHFQQPFAEGADLVTGSTHKTFFGTQRGAIGGRFVETDTKYELWEAVRRRAFPGAVSNHHLGTLVGLLMAAYEMNHFKDDYQQAVLANAKAFARALANAGMDVAGDPAMDYTQTHQVIVRVGYGRGPEIAQRLEANNIVCNYQAAPDEESFTAAGALRLGVAEMTRFGMTAIDFEELAEIMADVIVRDVDASETVQSFRQRFTDLHYCFDSNEHADLIQQLHGLI
ncbi:MAG: glycine cleavage system aminomethyltransferase GcvT [Planctomycetota bacterium]|jgi:aminomethyltransferase